MRSTLRQAMLALSILATLGLAACGGTAAATVRPVTEKLSVDAKAVPVAGRDQRILTTSGGITLYYFTADEEGSVLACTASCLSIWPPLLLPQAAHLTSQGTLPGKLGTIARPGGTRQVTYEGWPLYRFTGDSAPGDVKGQGIAGKWFAATAQVPETVPAPPPPTPAPTPPPPPPTPTPVPPAQPAPPAPATRPPVVATPPPPPAFNDGDGDNHGGSSDGDGNG